MPTIKLASNPKKTLQLKRNVDGLLQLPEIDLLQADETPLAFTVDGAVVGQMDIEKDELFLQLTEPVFITKLPNKKKITVKSAAEIQLQGDFTLDELSIDARFVQFNRSFLSAKKFILKGDGQLADTKFKCVALAMTGRLDIQNDCHIYCNELLQKNSKITFKKADLIIKALWQQDEKSKLTASKGTIYCKDKALLSGENTAVNIHWRGNSIVNSGKMHCAQVTFDLNELYNQGLCDLRLSEMQCKKRLQDSKDAKWVLLETNKLLAKDFHLESKSDFKDCLIKTNAMWGFGESTFENADVESDFFLTEKQSKTTLKNTELKAKQEVLAGEMKSQHSLQQTQDLLSFNKLDVELDSNVTAKNALLKGAVNLNASVAELDAVQLSGQNTLQKSKVHAAILNQAPESTVHATETLLQATKISIAGKVVTEKSLVSSEQVTLTPTATMTLAESNLVAETVYNRGELTVNVIGEEKKGIAATTLLSQGHLATNHAVVAVKDLRLSKESETHLQDSAVASQQVLFSGQTTLNRTRVQSETAVVEGTMHTVDAQIAASESIEFTSAANIDGTNLQLDAPAVLNSAKVAVEKLQITGDYFLNNGEIETKKIFDVRSNQGFVNAFGRIKSPHMNLMSGGFIANIGGDLCGADLLNCKSLLQLNLLGSERSWNATSASIISVKQFGLVAPLTTPSDHQAVLTVDKGVAALRIILANAFPSYANPINFVYNTVSFGYNHAARLYGGYQKFSANECSLTKQLASLSRVDLVNFTVDAARMAISSMNFSNQFNLANLTQVTPSTFDLKTAVNQIAYNGIQLFMPNYSQDSVFDFDFGLTAFANGFENHVAAAEFGVKSALFSQTNLSSHLLNNGVITSGFGITNLQAHYYGGNGAILGNHHVLQFDHVDNPQALAQGMGAYKHVIARKSFSLAVNQDLLITDLSNRQCDVNLQGTTVHSSADRTGQHRLSLTSTVGDVQTDGNLEASAVALKSNTHVVNRGSIKAKQTHVEAEGTFYNQNGHLETDKLTGHAARAVNAYIDSADEAQPGESMWKSYERAYNQGKDGDITADDLKLDEEVDVYLPGEELHQCHVVDDKNRGVIHTKESQFAVVVDDFVNRGGAYANDVNGTLDVARDVINRPRHKRVETRFGTEHQYTPARLIGGTGEGHDGVGLRVVAGGNIVGAAGSVSSVGSNVLQAGHKIDLSAFQSTSHSFQKQGRTSVHQTRVTVFGNEVSSEKGENILIAGVEGVEATATLFKSAKGTKVYSVGPVKLDPIKYSESLQLKQRSFWGSRRVSAQQEYSMGCRITDNGISVIISEKGGVHGTDLSLGGGGHLYIKAHLPVRFDTSVLKKQYKESSWAIGFSIGRFQFGGLKNDALLRILKADPFLAQACTVATADDNLTRVTEAVILADQVRKDANDLGHAESLSDALLKRYELSTKNGVHPKIGVQFTQATSKQKTEQSSSASIDRGHIEIEAPEVHLNSDVHAGNGMNVKAKVLTVQGHELHNQQSSRSVTVGVNMLEGNFQSADVSVASSSSDARVAQNKQLVVDGNLNLDVGVMNINSGNVRAGSVSGHVDTLNIKTKQDEIHSQNHQVSVSTTGDVSVAATKHHSVTSNLVSGLHSEEGFNTNPDHAFTVGETNNVGGAITSKEPGTFKSGTLNSVTLHDTQKTIGFSVATNVASLANTVASLASSTPATTTMRVGGQHEDVRRDQLAVITGNVEADTIVGEFASSEKEAKRVTRNERYKGSTQFEFANAAGYQQNGENLKNKWSQFAEKKPVAPQAELVVEQDLPEFDETPNVVGNYFGTYPQPDLQESADDRIPSVDMVQPWSYFDEMGEGIGLEYTEDEPDLDSSEVASTMPAAEIPEEKINFLDFLTRNSTGNSDYDLGILILLTLSEGYVPSRPTLIKELDLLIEEAIMKKEAPLRIPFDHHRLYDDYEKKFADYIEHVKSQKPLRVPLVYRGEYGDPETVFKNGIQARGTQLDPGLHFYKPKKTALVSTSYSPGIAIAFPQFPKKRITYLYEIALPKQHLAMVKGLIPDLFNGKVKLEDFTVLMPIEQEVVIPFKIDPRDIRGAWEVHNTPLLPKPDTNSDYMREIKGDMIPNPNYQPRRYISRATIGGVKVIVVGATVYTVYDSIDKTIASDNHVKEGIHQVARVAAGAKAVAVAYPIAAMGCTGALGALPGGVVAAPLCTFLAPIVAGETAMRVVDNAPNLLVPACTVAKSLTTALSGKRVDVLAAGLSCEYALKIAPEKVTRKINDKAADLLETIYNSHYGFHR